MLRTTLDIIGNKVQECKKYVFADMSALFYGKNELFALLFRRKILFPIMSIIETILKIFSEIY